MVLFLILVASFLETVVAFIGQLAVFIFSDRIKQYIQYFISFAVGTLLAVVFFDIIPEGLSTNTPETFFAYVLGGFLFFFVLTRAISWYHCHSKECFTHHTAKNKQTGMKVLAGDTVHNFVDGIVITLAFLADFRLGIVTSVAVLVHEAPMEMSDFFILLHSGYSRQKALFYNFLIALTTPLGALLAYFFTALSFDNLIGPALGIVAGNFLYIAAVDLIPELHDHDNGDISIKTVLQFLSILAGILVIYYLGVVLE